MQDLTDFLFFPENKITIGIDPIAAEHVFSSLNNSNIKKDYIKASTPAINITYRQFYIQKKLITLKQFRGFISESLYITDAEKEGWGWIWNGKWMKKHNVSWKNPFLNKYDQYYNDYEDIFPVMQISWNDAIEFTKWLSFKTGDNLRLPTEYEWEVFGNYAGLNSITDINSEIIKKIDSDDEYIIMLKDLIRDSQFQTGLLWEWTLDWYNGYDESVYNKDFGKIYKILRGGSILSENIQKSREFRFRRCPTARSPYYGFRIVFDKTK